MNTLQKANFRRKVLYFAILLVLFTVSMFWRGTIPIPLSSTARAGEPPSGLHRIADGLNNRTILSQARGLELRELEEGEPEIAGSAVRLALIGSRGLAVTALWQAAIEKQKRNDFHEMELLVRQVTRLQPHFITPWIFQSWNIAYNVSVEMHGSGDMYFYIARGIELLAEGERRNNKSPDMRWQIGFYYSNKFGVADNVEVLRCLFQLSCIPPDKRNPDALIDPQTGQVDLVKFRAFCEEYPHLVRRLRGEDFRVGSGDEQLRRKVQEALKCPRPEDVIQFLRDNRDVPSRYKSATELADADKQFPALPPQFNEGPDEAHPGLVLKDDFTGFKAARAWFSYSLLPLPPNPVDEFGKAIPSRTPQPGEYDPIKYRVPRQPMMIIFRQGAPRVQSSQGEMEQKEGWFDDEGWRIDDPRDEPQNWWFPDPAAPPGRPRPLDVVIGRERPWSLQEWQKAAEMWDKHGEAYGLKLTQAQLDNYRALAQQVPNDINPTDATPEQKEQPWYRAGLAMLCYQQNRGVTNFPYFLAAAQAEAKKETVLARKTLWQAEQARKLGNKPLATRLYEGEYDAAGNLIKKGGLLLWKDVLINNPDFHRPEQSDRTEEETYMYLIEYMRMIVQDDDRVRAKANEVVHGCGAVVPFLPPPFPQTLAAQQRRANDRVLAAVPFAPLPYPDAMGWDPPGSTPQWGTDLREDIKWYVAENYFSPFAGLMDVNDDRRGTPWIRPDVKDSVRMQQGVMRRGAASQSSQPAPGGTQLPPTRGGSQ